MRLAELGYVFNPDQLESWKADSFIIIGAELDALREKEMKKNGNRAGHKG